MMTCHTAHCSHNSFLQPEDFQTTVRLFRLNSLVKATGRKEEAEAEAERQQWDDPMGFRMSCISMSAGEMIGLQLDQNKKPISVIQC